MSSYSQLINKLVKTISQLLVFMCINHTRNYPLKSKLTKSNSALQTITLNDALHCFPSEHMIWCNFTHGCVIFSYKYICMWPWNTVDDLEIQSWHMYSTVFVMCHFSTNCVDANSSVDINLNRLLVIFYQILFK